MEKLYFVTGNQGKFKEAQKFIPELEMFDIDLPEIQELDSEEIIRHKLREAQAERDGNFVVEDISFQLPALNGLPGPLIKWFLKTIGKEGVYDLVKEKEDHSACVICEIGLLYKGKMHFFKGEVKGQIVAPRGEYGFGWDPIFKPEGSKRTFGQMPRARKADYSMRIKAFKKVKDFLVK